MSGLNAFAEKYLAAKVSSITKWSEGEKYALAAAMKMYQNLGSEGCRRVILDWAGKAVSSDGDFTENSLADHEGWLGRFILFAYLETGEERFRLALDHLVKQSGDIASIQDACFLMPFLAEYDVKLGDKQLAKAIANKFQKMNAERPCEALPFDSLSLFMLSLSETLEKMDIQLYEHFRVLADMLLLSAQTSLNIWKREYARMPKEELPWGSVCAFVSALFQGVHIGALDEEKYLPLAESLLTMAKKWFVCETEPGDYRFANDQFEKEAGLFFLALAAERGRAQ